MAKFFHPMISVGAKHRSWGRLVAVYRTPLVNPPPPPGPPCWPSALSHREDGGLYHLSAPSYSYMLRPFPPVFQQSCRPINLRLSIRVYGGEVDAVVSDAAESLDNNPLPFTVAFVCCRMKTSRLMYIKSPVEHVGGVPHAVETIRPGTTGAHRCCPVPPAHIHVPALLHRQNVDFASVEQPLHMAAKSGEPEVLNLLIKNGADVNVLIPLQSYVGPSVRVYRAARARAQCGAGVETWVPNVPPTPLLREQRWLRQILGLWYCSQGGVYGAPINTPLCEGEEGIPRVARATAAWRSGHAVSQNSRGCRRGSGRGNEEEPGFLWC